MRRNKKSLYENIMSAVSKEVKKALRETNEYQFDKYKPQTRNQLRQVIDDYIQENGPHCDLNWIDVSNVRDMQDIFYDSNFNGDISKWDVSNVERMDRMFYRSAFNGDISNWDVSKVKNKKDMFFYCPLKNNPPKWYNK